MAESVDVPAVGRVDKKWIYAGGAVIVGIVGWAWISRSRDRSAEEVVEDPLAGTTGDAAYTNPNPVREIPGEVDSSTGGSIDTNAEWADAVTEKLSNMGYDSAVISAVLGKYLARVPLTNEEAGLIRTAWAYQGKPPQGPNNFTLTGGGSTTGNPKLTAPKLTAGAPTDTTVSLSWTAVAGAQAYCVYRDGSKAAEATTTSWKSVGLTPGKSHSYYVKAKSGATLGPASNTVTVATKPKPAAPPKKTTDPKKPAAQYISVPVVKFTTKNPPWNSTISGIAAHYGYGGNWGQVWNDPKNEPLRRKRGQPNQIQPGDVVYVKRRG